MKLSDVAANFCTFTFTRKIAAFVLRNVMGIIIISCADNYYDNENNYGRSVCTISIVLYYLTLCPSECRTGSLTLINS